MNLQENMTQKCSEKGKYLVPNKNVKYEASKGKKYHGTVEYTRALESESPQLEI